MVRQEVAEDEDRALGRADPWGDGGIARVSIDGTVVGDIDLFAPNQDELQATVFSVTAMLSVPVAVGHFAGAVGLWALWISALLLTRRRQRAVEIAPERPLKKEVQ